MSKYKISIAFSVLLLAACTQPPAPIALKGQESFTKSGASTNGRYATGRDPSAYTPAISSAISPVISDETYQNVAVDSIGVSDLSAPTFTNKPVLGKQPNALAAPVSAPVNSWTNKPRSEAQSLEEPRADATATAPSTEEQVAIKPAITASSETKGFQWPVSSKKIVSSFGDKGAGRVNDGVSIAANDDEAVHAAAGGEVVYVNDELKGYGNMVIIKHSGGKTTSYARLGRATVDKYDRVAQGDIIGYVGKTGNAKTPQLFFSLRNGKQAIDPTKYMSNEVAGL